MDQLLSGVRCQPALVALPDFRSRGQLVAEALVATESLSALIYLLEMGGFSSDGLV